MHATSSSFGDRFDNYDSSDHDDGSSEHSSDDDMPLSRVSKIIYPSKSITSGESNARNTHHTIAARTVFKPIKKSNQFQPLFKPRNQSHQSHGTRPGSAPPRRFLADQCRAALAGVDAEDSKKKTVRHKKQDATNRAHWRWVITESDTTQDIMRSRLRPKSAAGPVRASVGRR